MEPFIRRTKIVCTLGPASCSPGQIRDLIQAGMDVARLNFSHGTHDYHRGLIRIIRKSSTELNRHVAILQDLSGPKIRIGVIEGNGLELRAGAEFILTNRQIKGHEGEVSVNYPSLPKEVKKGDPILLVDGSIELRVVKSEKGDILCKVVVGGLLTSHKGINLPSGTLNVPALTEKDKEDLAFGMQEGVDYIALSFVRRSEDILELRTLISREGLSIPIIAKIEKHEALENIKGIVDLADGIMVARGDLGVEIPLERVPILQKSLVREANRAKKLVIIATQMLKSMVDNPRPTRAEVTDVANAILDGTDAIMLSEETAVGHYPRESVEEMSRVALWTEQSLLEEGNSKGGQLTVSGTTVQEAIGHAVSLIARDLCAAAIVTPTESGSTARLISKYRPYSPIIAICRNLVVARRLSLCWGVVPIQTTEMANVDELLDRARAIALTTEFVKKGDVVIITAGLPIQAAGVTNMIKVDILE